MSEASSNPPARPGWTHPSFLRLQIEKAKKENQDKARVNTSAVREEQPVQAPAEMPATQHHVPTVVSQIGEKPHGIYAVSILEETALPNPLDISTSGFFQINEQKLHEQKHEQDAADNVNRVTSYLDTMLQLYRNAQSAGSRDNAQRDLTVPSVLTIPGEIEGIREIEHSLRAELVDYAAVIQSLKPDAVRDAPPSGAFDAKTVITRIFIDRLRSVPLLVPERASGEYTIVEKILRDVANGKIDTSLESQAAKKYAIAFYEELMTSPEWTTNPATYLGYLGALSVDINEGTSVGILTKMVEVCNTAIANIETYLREQYTSTDALGKERSHINPSSAFPTNRYLGYFFAVRTVLLLKLNKVGAAIYYLFQAINFQGKFIMLDFVEQYNATVLMVALLTGSIGPAMSSISRFSHDLLTIQFPTAMQLPTHIQRAVHSVMSRTHKLIEGAITHSHAPIFMAAEKAFRNLSLRFNIANGTDEIDTIVLHHAHMGPVSDFTFLLQAYAANAFDGVLCLHLQETISAPGMATIKKYLLIAQILQGGNRDFARVLTSVCMRLFQEELGKASVNEVVPAMLFDKVADAEGSTSDRVGMMLIVALFEGLHNRIENARRILNTLVFAKKQAAIPLLLLILKERIALCFVIDNPKTDDLGWLLNKIVSRLPREAPRAADSTERMLLAALGLHGPISPAAHVVLCAFHWMCQLSKRSGGAPNLSAFVESLRRPTKFVHPGVMVAVEHGAALYNANLHNIAVPVAHLPAQRRT